MRELRALFFVLSLQFTCSCKLKRRLLYLRFQRGRLLLPCGHLAQVDGSAFTKELCALLAQTLEHFCVRRLAQQVSRPAPLFRLLLLRSILFVHCICSVVLIEYTHLIANLNRYVRLRKISSTGVVGKLLS